MTFSDLPPSRHWATLNFRGEKLAEVWFKPEGQPDSLLIRIGEPSFHLPGLGPRLTLENLLKAVGVSPDEVASWNDDQEQTPRNSPEELQQPLQPPAPGFAHRVLHIHVQSATTEPVADTPGQVPPNPESPASEQEQDTPSGAEVSEETWQDLESRWKAILGLEASMETLRLSMESQQGELEASSRRTLSTEEKLHALNGDIATWTKAKSRVLYVVPKLKEFVHRSTWVTATPERKKLEEIYKNHIRTRTPYPEMGTLLEKLENLLKDHQVLLSQGVSVQQECAGVQGTVQGALSTLKSNSAARAVKKRK